LKKIAPPRYVVQSLRSRGSEPDRGLFVAAEFEEMPQPHGLNRRLGQVHALGGVVVQGVLLRIEVPLAGRVELLEDVLDEPVLAVHAHLAVVLPPADVPELAAGVLAGDPVVKVAPEGAVHGVQEPTGRVRPGLDPLRADAVG